MAIPKVLGIETEYGIMCDPGEDQNPTAASSLLINAYLDSLTNAGLASNRHRVAWDFSDESPDADARGVLAQFALPPRQRRPDERGSLLRRPCTPRVLEPRGIKPDRSGHLGSSG